MFQQTTKPGKTDLPDSEMIEPREPTSMRWLMACAGRHHRWGGAQQKRAPDRVEDKDHSPLVRTQPETLKLRGYHLTPRFSESIDSAFVQSLRKETMQLSAGKKCGEKNASPGDSQIEK